MSWQLIHALPYSAWLIKRNTKSPINIYFFLLNRVAPNYAYERKNRIEE